MKMLHFAHSRWFLVLGFVWLAMSSVGTAQEVLATRGAMGLIGPVSKVTEQEALNATDEPFQSKTKMFSQDGFLVSATEECTDISCATSTYRWKDGLMVEERRQSGLGAWIIRFEYGSDRRVTKKTEIEQFPGSSSSLTSETNYIESAEGSEEIETVSGFPSRHLTRRFQEPKGVELVTSARYYGDLAGSGHWEEESRTVTTESQADGATRTTAVASDVTRIWIRDRERRLLEESFKAPDAFGRTTYHYDAKGREDERSEWTGDGERINRRRYAFEEDRNGNWTQQTEYFTSSAMDTEVAGPVIRRKLEYYK